MAANATYFYNTDANKNVSDLTDSTGAIVAHYEYSPFGVQTKAIGAYAESNPFRFSSEYYDTETGLVYYNYRYYSPDLGRWLSRDPIAEKGGWNLYGMVKNAVIKHFDLLGLKIPISLDEASNMILHYSCINSANAAFESGMEKCEGENCRSAKLKCYGRISRWHRNAVSTCDEQYGGNGPTTFPADLPDYGQPWWITVIEKINDAFAAQSKSRWN